MPKVWRMQCSNKFIGTVVLTSLLTLDLLAWTAALILLVVLDYLLGDGLPRLAFAGTLGWGLATNLLRSATFGWRFWRGTVT